MELLVQPTIEQEFPEVAVGIEATTSLLNVLIFETITSFDTCGCGIPELNIVENDGVGANDVCGCTVLEIV